MSHPIQNFRQLRGISLRTLERATGISYVKLHHLEHGRRASQRELMRIARVLAVPPESLDVEREGAYAG